MKLYLGRQPILDIKKKTIAYELLYRSGEKLNVFPDIDGSEATTRVLYTFFFGMTPKEVTGGKEAFINFTRDLLLAKLPQNLRTDEVVIEILEGQKIDQPFLDACANLKDRGFKLALDDFILNEDTRMLLPLASIIKVDWRATDRKRIAEICDDVSQYNLDLLAEKIETNQEFEEAKALGFRYFQGFFFTRPVILERDEVPIAHWSWLKIFSALQRPELDFKEISQIIARDPALSYQLLKIINSAFFGLTKKVSSIEQAVILLGEKEIRRWLSLLVLTRISQDKPAEIMVTACVRGRMGELLAEACGKGELAPTVFLMGILSLLDAIMGRPMKEVLADLPLDPQLVQVLTQHKGPLSPFYFLVRGYEYGNDSIMTQSARILGLDEETVTRCYIEAINWADKLSKVTR